jgi:hypothetical protein
MYPLEVYYLNQGGHCLTHLGGRPCLFNLLYLQRGNGLGNFFGSLFRRVQPLLWFWANPWVAKRCVTEAKF